MTISANFPSITPTLELDFASTRTLDPRVTFTRSTGNATYYDGKTSVVAEQNLITYSQTFTGWASAGITFANTSTVLAPDGTATAYKITEDATTGTHRIWSSSNFTTGLNYTVSVYVKYIARQYIQLNVGQWSNARVVYDILNGTVTDINAGVVPAVSAFIVPVGNGWYRLVATATSLGNYTGSTTPVGSNNSATGNGETGAGINADAWYMWGYQMEQRSAVTTYTVTTSSAITKYIPTLQTAAINQARFPVDPITSESLGLLIEAQRTNLMLYSSSLSNAVYTATNITINTSTNIAPDGTQSAVTIINNSGTTGTFYQVVNISSTTTAYAFSVYLKAAGVTTVRMQANNGVGSLWMDVDLSAGTVSGISSSSYSVAATSPVVPPVSASISAVGNGWYRASMSFLPMSITPTLFFVNSMAAGNGWSGFYAWGTQLESGGWFSTSYIATTGSTVTRPVDSPQISVANLSNWYNTTQGTFVFDVKPFGLDSTHPGYYLYSTVYSLGINGFLSRIQAAEMGYVNSGDVAMNPTFTLYPNITTKVAFEGVNSAVWNTKNINVAQNGLASNSGSGVYPWNGGTLPTNSGTQQALLLGPDVGYGPNLNGTMKRCVFYSRPLTSLQLGVLTTL